MEAERLRAHIGDLIASPSPRFSCFLDEGEQSAAQRLCERAGCPFRFWGGWEGAQRRVLGVHAGEDTRFPVAAFQAQIPKGFTLTHRDFLGAILALGIKREVVGDILIEGETAYFFTLPQAQPLVLGELARIGRVGVRISSVEGQSIRYEQRYEEGEKTVASLRLDAVLAALLNASRQDAAALITAGLVSLNGQPCTKGTRSVADGDKLSVRGKGKFAVELCGRVTRKGRQVLLCKRFL